MLSYYGYKNAVIGRVSSEAHSRENPSSAGSGSGEGIKEVHPGADLVKQVCLAKYDSHSLRASSEGNCLY